MNFPEYDCENEEILELLSHLPITTVDDYQWMQKYIDDLQLHYEKGEYELAVISAHMIYMFIVYCYILKKKEFDINVIKADFHCDKEHCPQKQTDISPYLYVYKGDKKCFDYLKIQAKKKKHISIVNTRDRVAHCSGNILEEVDFLEYLKKCIDNIINVKNIIWEDFRRSDKFKQSIQNMTDWNDTISIFLISQEEFKDLSQTEFKNLLNDKCNSKIQEKLSDISFWQNVIDNTTPANYGVNGSDIWVDNITLDYENMDSEYIEGTFEADISMDITFQMGASNPEDGYEEHYSKQHHITGSFDYDITSDEFNIKMDEFPSIDFYAE